MNDATALLIVASFFIGVALQRMRRHYANMAGIHIEEDNDD